MTDIDMTGTTARLVRRLGPAAADWCATAPALARAFAARWGLDLGAPFESGAASLTLRCVGPGGARSVLKLSPDRALLAAQTGMLRLHAPSGRVPAVLAADEDAGAVLLEAVEPGAIAEDLPIESLPELWAELLAALHAVPEPARPLPALRDRCEESYARIGRRLAEPAVAARIGTATWRRAIERCRALLDTTAEPVVLHGDLHLGNAIDGGPRRGLVAIDPKVCVGDACFDAVDFVVSGAGHEGVEARCGRVAAACGLDGDRLLTWAKAIAPMFAISYHDDGDAESTVDELLTLAR